MGIYYVAGVPYSSDYLMHFGILGMHWGIRRFQNPDGTLTAAGKKRYAKELKEKEETEKRQAFEKERAAATNQMVKDFSNANFFVTIDTESKRAKEAADTGLKALARTGHSSQYGLEDLDSMSEKELQYNREWFILEDQTVGLATIADLANQGKSKAEIRNLIDKAFEYTQRYGYPESKNDTINSAVFLLAENGNIKNTEAGLRYGKYVDDFIDACIKERRIRHTEDDSDELYHHGIKGQKWGIRRFQNPDGTLTEAGKKRYSDVRVLKDAYEWNTRNGEKKYFKVKGLLKDKVLDNSYNESLDILFKNSDFKKSYDAFFDQWVKSQVLWRKAREQRGSLPWNEYINTKAYKEYSKATDDYWKMRYDFSGKALREIGYSDTIKARKYLDGIIFDD